MTLIQSLSPHPNPRSPFLSYRIPRLQTLTRYSRRPHLRVRFSLDELLKTLVSSKPLDLIPSALTLASTAAALYLSRRQFSGPKPEPIIADWILITSPTPFNRCVLLRCPSISFEEESEKLLREERHFVNLNRGRILRGRDEGVSEGEIGFQRVCVATEDGGVISLDWPENLDLGKEYGLDTTVLIVPGTGEGSLDRDVRMFMLEVLRSGCFPVVVNPRGCAGSPLTTARLFTAADSDDVCTAVKYVNRSRPWTTLMGVGLGYGANMLTKYLAEVGESTPLTAVVCINNPFDLEEATRSLPHHIAMDQKLIGGLLEILRANKELFQGKAKKFDVAKALSATSVRDFDRAVSMISYGFDNVENFYSVTSTRELVPKLKVPVLFIQSDDGTVPLFSVPRSAIAENPFTSLLLCSSHHPDIGRTEDSAIHWCQQLAIEWLSAVELALLKSRHPLLKDVDITINPPKGLPFINGESSGENIAIQNRYPGIYDSSKWFLSRMNANNNMLKPSSSNTVNGFLTDQFFNDRDGVAQGKVNSPSNLESELGRMQKGDQGIKEDGDVDASENCPINSSTTEQDSPADAEESQVLQTAAVVMNILDVTMPDTLDDEQKKKVLTAMERGETLVKALEGAVPDDVRGKLTTAVTEIMQTQGTSLNFDGLKRIGWIHNMTSGKSKVQEKSEGTSAAESGQDDTCPSYERKNGSLRDGRTQETIESTPKSTETSEERDGQATGKSKAHEKLEGTLSAESGQDDTGPSDTRKNGTVRDGITQETSESTPKSTEAFQERAGQAAANAEAATEMDSKQGQPDKLEETGGGIDENNAEQVLDDGNGIHTSETKKSDSSREQNLPTSSINSEEEAPSASSSDSEHQVVEKANDVQKNENKATQDVADPNVQSSTKTEASMPQHSSSKPPSISVTQALGAFTGFDDSTQMAVNSVYGVIEDMIDQFEKVSNQENGDEVKNNESREFVNSKKTDESNNKSGIESDVLKLSNHPESSPKVEQAKSYEEVKDNLKKVSHNLTSSINNSIGQVKKSNTAFDLNKVNHANYFPLLDVAGNQYWNSPYAAYLHRYFSAQLPTMKSIDSDSTTDLFLDPEGRWRMIDQPGDGKNASGSGKNESINGRNQIVHKNGMENFIEPCYVIPDNEFSQFEHISAKENEALGDKHNDGKAHFRCLIRNALLEALKVEVGRRVGGDSDLEDLEGGLVNDLEQFADTVSQAVVHDKELYLDSFSECSGTDSIMFGTIEATHIIKIISSATLGANHLQKVLPLGVIVGSGLATLRTYFHVVSLHDDGQNEVIHESRHMPKNSYGQESETKKGISANAINHHVNLDEPIKEGQEKLQADDLNNDGIMVGAITAALGASALLAHHEQKQMHENDENMDVPFVSFNEKGSHDKDIEAMQEKNQNSLVSSLAEKAMSVAAPVVPTKDGEVDQERLVAVLAELGQKGGILRLVGKAALLWGGIRGAMSLTDRLISFLHIAERPLFLRILGFVFMALVLWSPIVIPLLPTIVQSWTTKTSNIIVDYACILGLYVAVTILIILWGKRIRGYQNPLQEYGLELTSSSMIRDFCKGLVGGTMIVLCIHSINVLLGYAQLSWTGLPLSSQGALVLLKAYGSMLLLVVRGTITAIGISVVEELLFRSWLAEEVAADLGYDRAILVSGLVFSLCQRSLPSIPGFILLSLALFGMKQRTGGNLSAPIGMRAGIMTANFVLQTGGFLIFWPSTPFWIASKHPWHPFDGVIGLCFCAILAIFFYPQPLQRKETLKDVHIDHQLEEEDSSRADDGS